MQLFPRQGDVDFQESGWRSREREEDDRLFYTKPRLVNHIDKVARQHLTESFSTVLTREMKVLDLMASMNSHLPDGFQASGLGMNTEEMNKNKQLTDIHLHDLNSKNVLPFPRENFDAVICNLSIEYLLDPQKIVEECGRVLTKNGVLFISFSKRWFPEKVTQLWKKLHEFERVGFAMNLLRSGFADIQTSSFRNWPRPLDDRHYMKLQTSDPVYIVVGRKP